MKGISFIVELISDDVLDSKKDSVVILRRPDGQPLECVDSISAIPSSIEKVLSNLQSSAKNVD